MIIDILGWLFIVALCIPLLKLSYKFLIHIIKGIENGKKFGFKEGIQYIVHGRGYNNWW